MSYSYQYTPSVAVLDPRVILENQRAYAILKSGSQTNYKQWTTTSVSNSSIIFSCAPPSGGIIVDRKIYFLLPTRTTFVGLAPVGQTLLNQFQFAPRAWPIQGSIDTFQATINNSSVSINIADMIHAISHYNTGAVVTESDFSLSPTQLDQSQEYSDLFGSIRSPFAGYGDSTDQSVMSRGGFPFTIVSNPVSTNAETPITAVVDAVFCEPILLSPMYFGCGNASGLFNVTSMDFNITFLMNAAYRMWSLDAVSEGVQVTMQSQSVQFNGFQSPSFSYPETQPLMLINYITPLETQILPSLSPITYPYFELQRFPTDSGSAAPLGTPIQITANNIQLASIPNRMYIYARRRNQDLYSSSEYTDTFLSILNLSIQFQNKSGLLSSANQRQLYTMAVKNGCNMNWTQFSGGQVNNPNFTSMYGSCGGISCIEFASDIGLDSLTAPGINGQYQLQVTATVQNNSNDDTLIPTLYVVCVLEGTWTIPTRGTAIQQIGVISSQDVLDAQQNPMVSYADVQEIQGVNAGGNFFSGLKKFGESLGKAIVPVLRDTRLISKTLPRLGFDQAGKASEFLGFGEGGVLVGGGRKRGRGRGKKVGGALLSDAALRRRLRM
jgi:hypothetical protein